MFRPPETPKPRLLKGKAKRRKNWQAKADPNRSGAKDATDKNASTKGR